MPAIGAFWAPFHRAPHPGNIPGSKNKTDHEARCKKCVEDVVEAIRQEDLARQEATGIRARTEQVIMVYIMGPPPLPRAGENIHPDTHRPERIVGKPDNLRKHLIECPSKRWGPGEREFAIATMPAPARRPPPTQWPPQYHPGITFTFPNQQQGTAPPATYHASGIPMYNDCPRPQRVCINEHGHVEPIERPAEQMPWSPQRVDQFNEMLCRLLISCSIAWRVVEQVYWRRFFAKWLPDAPMPGREELSGRILDRVAGKCVEDLQADTQHRFATLQCDGWKNAAKAAIIGFAANVEYETYLIDSVDVSTERKNAENLLAHVKKRLEFMRSVLLMVVVAICTDCSGESAKMRRDLARECTWLVSLDCWSHQTNLMVIDILKGPLKMTVEDMLEVVKWFLSHTRALALLRAASTQVTTRTLGLVLPRMLELKTSMQYLVLVKENELLLCGGEKRDAKEKAAKVMAIIKQPHFWSSIEQLNTVLRPLAIAANATQSDSARLDVVVILLGCLYHIFSNPDVHSIDEETGRAGCATIEKRWEKADQPIFLLCVAGNPFVRTSAFDPDGPLTEVETVVNMAVAAYLRFYCQDPGAAFRRECRDYVLRSGRWTNDRLNLDQKRKDADELGRDVNMLEFWLNLGVTEDDAVCVGGRSRIPESGRGRLALLFARIMAMVPNSAAIERIFSLFGIIHTKRRSRLGNEKMTKSVIVQQNTARANGLHPRRKREFSEFIDEDMDSKERRARGVVMEGVIDVARGDTVQAAGAGTDVQFFEAAGADELLSLLEDVEMREEGQGAAASRTVPTSGKVAIASIFSYPAATGPMSGAQARFKKFCARYERAGQVTLNDEIELHDRIHAHALGASTATAD